MTLENKNKVINNLVDEINSYQHFYITDISDMNAEITAKLRKKCYEKNIKLVVAKNSLLKIALEKADGNYQPLFEVLKGSSSVMFSNVGNIPGKLIREFRKEYSKPVLKGAYVEESVFIGDAQLESVINIKSKEELIGEVISLLQSPVRNVISALQSGGNKLAGCLKTLSENKQ
ncbi:MAG: 50S ribosomal protein L10 [Bacteroidia bacterium]|nr:50S ribosomal protein L10 [Bacteroidia bacterium]